MATAQTLNRANAANTGTGSTKTGVAPCALRACEPTSLTIQQLPDGRSSKKRSYVLDATGKPTRGEDYVLEVLSDSSAPTVLAIKFSGACAHGKPSASPQSKDASQRFRSNSNDACPAVAVSGPRCSVTQPSPVHVEVFPDVERIDKSFSGLLQHYLIPSAFHPAVYTVQSKKCGGSGKLSARVEVFPRIEVKGKLSLEYKPTNQHHSKAKHGDDEWPLVLEGAIECKADGHEWKIGGKSAAKKGQDDVSEEFLKSGQRRISEWLKKLSEMNKKQRRSAADNLKFDIKWPKLEFEASCANVEMEDGYAVESETKIKLGCAPLIGAEIKIDILGFLLTANAIGVVLNRIRNIVEEGVESEHYQAKGKIIIALTVAGEIAGGVDAAKKLATPWETKGKIEGKIGLGLEAKIAAEASANACGFEVRFGAGAALELKGAEQGSKTCDIGGEITFVAEEHKSANGAESKSQLGVEGAIKFNGLAIYYLVYFEASVNRVDSKSKQVGGKRNRKEGKSDDEPKNLENTEKHEGIVPLCDPWEWPEKPSTSVKGSASPLTPLHKALS